MGQFSQVAPELFAGTSLFGSMLESSGLRAEGQAAQAAANYNARLATDEGFAEEARLRRESARHLSRRAVASYKSGVAFEGTSLEAAIADFETLEREALTARKHGLDAARLERASGRASASSARMAAGASVLGGLARAGSTYYGLRYPSGAPRPRPAGAAP